MNDHQQLLHQEDLLHQQHHISFISTTHRRSSSSSTTTTTDSSVANIKNNTDSQSPLLLSSSSVEKNQTPTHQKLKHNHPQPSFSIITLILQTLPSLLLSLLGASLTGILLQHVQNWTAFLRVPELYILLPVLMNLKGNLEMNLAARLSTSANVGDLDMPQKRRALVIGNLTLLQVQALIVSFAASLVSFLLGLLSRNNLPSIRIAHAKPLTTVVQPSLPSWNTPLQGGYAECLLVLAAGMLAASVNSLLLGALVSGLVIACRILRINPDNITTPIASSLGDLMTLVFLSLASSMFIRYAETAISTVIFILLACSVGLHGYATFKNGFVQGFLRVGWTPLFVAMAISTCSGLVLEKVVTNLHGFAIIAPVLTGICGNIGTISVSRISTALHASLVVHPSSSPTRDRKPSPNGFRKLAAHDDDLEEEEEEELDLEIDDFDQGLDPLPVPLPLNEPARKVAIVLMLLGTSILAGFALINMGLGNQQTGFDLSFFIGFMLCAIWTSTVSLMGAYHLTHFLWKLNLDPDIYAIPILSSSVDLIGQVSLVLTFMLFRK